MKRKGKVKKAKSSGSRRVAKARPIQKAKPKAARKVSAKQAESDLAASIGVALKGLKEQQTAANEILNVIADHMETLLDIAEGKHTNTAVAGDAESWEDVKPLEPSVFKADDEPQRPDVEVDHGV